MIFFEHDKPGHHYIKRLLDPMVYRVTAVHCCLYRAVYKNY